MEALAAYAGLFTVAFLAATLLPAQSEAALVGLLALERYPEMLLLAVASAGNVLGSCVSYALGRSLAHSKRLLRLIDPRNRERAESWYRCYGKWSLLASWLPIIGDPLTVIAGTLREPFIVFVVLVTAAKMGRYLVIMALYQSWFG
jgi:membrane protein YqaA with SNARE-associated domain